MPVLGDETGGLGEGAVLVLHDEATLLPVAQQDGKLRLGAMNLTDVLNLSLVKGVIITFAGARSASSSFFIKSI